MDAVAIVDDETVESFEATFDTFQLAAGVGSWDAIGKNSVEVTVFDKLVGGVGPLVAGLFIWVDPTVGSFADFLDPVRVFRNDIADGCVVTTVCGIGAPVE